MGGGPPTHPTLDSTSTPAQWQGSGLGCSEMFPAMKKQGGPSGEAPSSITGTPQGTSRAGGSTWPGSPLTSLLAWPLPSSEVPQWLRGVFSMKWVAFFAAWQLTSRRVMFTRSLMGWEKRTRYSPTGWGPTLGTWSRM